LDFVAGEVNLVVGHLDGVQGVSMASREMDLRNGVTTIRRGEIVPGGGGLRMRQLAE
jgi:hypothetical protein